ncbi:chemotaxis protein CheA [Eubacterium oxidoreducens]|uniref:Chemotaxis protein CheA n=1 Tax=Eubacterium oxidoreducens TaxID=1732 RepID=A0A1G6APP5_EUBOX|nr:chemotaxis protein CheA [Eubacterium oxidoreducens]SDB10331.1 two-component system, chemotaxis family, sensor kinase CheA [Eubacterium oxidoreducens]
MDVSQYLEIFIDETNGHLQDLSDSVMTLENEPDNMDMINEIFRAAHSLKGMAGTMGFKRMQHLTHDMENVFQEVRSGNMKVNSELIDVIFECLDAIEGYLDNVKATSDEGTDDNEALIKELNRVLASGTGQEISEESDEEAKETQDEQEASDEDDRAHYKNIRVDENETESIQNDLKDGLKLYGFTVYIEEECLLKAARAFLVFKAVEEAGQIMAYLPSSQDIEDENFENDFSFLFVTSQDIEPVISAIKAVSEISDVVWAELDDVPKDMPKEDKEETAPAVVEEKKESSPAPKVEKKETPAKTPAKKTAAKPVTSRTIRVDIEKLDALMNQVSELIIAKNSLVSISATEEGSFESQMFHEQIEYLERITTNLHESVMKVRMVPIESVVNKFPRMIRDLSKKLDKKMELHMSGEDTELDRTVVDQIGDPLQHLLRNSADHGLENAETRRERGKPETGTITLNAFQEGNNVIIEVSDDGNGIDIEKVRNKAIERGMYTEEQAEALSDKEVIDLLFMPSFSMAKEITDISGRGVGLDVVKSNIEALGGDVETHSVFGQGTKFTVRLPLTLAIIQALMVVVGQEKYAIALGSIANIEYINKDDIKYVQADEVIHIRGDVIPLIRLNQMLDIEPRDDESDNLTVVIVKKGERQVGLVVDDLMGQQEIVIKSLGKYINGNKIISGATILGDGEVALILDVNTLM